MKKKIILALVAPALLIALLLTVLPTSAATLTISSCQDLQDIRNNLDGDYKLTKDINCNGFEFEPIGDTSDPFEGTLDGGKNTIRNLSIDVGDAELELIGIFGVIGENGIVKNLNIKDVYINAPESDFVGGLVGALSGLVDNVNISGNVNGNNNVGGLVGTHEEPGGLGGSSPLLYTWNGEQYVYQADVGDPLPFFLDGEDYAHIDTLIPKDDKYSLKISQEYNEIVYYDELSLVTLDHAPNIQIANNLATGKKDKPEHFITLSATPTHPLQSCTDKYSNDCLSDLEAYDDKWSYKDKSFLNHWILDFGDLSNEDHINLIIRGAKDFSVVDTTNWNSFIWDIDVKDEEGNWVNIYNRTNMHSLLGTPRLFAISLKDKFISDDYQVRVTFKDTNVDYFAIDTTAPQPYTLNTIHPDYVNLSFRGYTAIDKTNYWKHDYDTVSPNPPELFKQQGGYFTKYGEVTPLLQNTDDKFVIMRYGDHLDVEFPLTSIPEDQTRSFMVFNHLNYKHALRAPTGITVEPLPYNGMTVYPPTSNPNLANPDYQNYLEEWNTRYYKPGKEGGSSTILNSCADVEVYGLSMVGGLVGNNKKLISKSCATGDVYGKDSGWPIGGLVGINFSAQASIQESYATGSVQSLVGSSYMGGLVGTNLFGSSIYNSYAVGSVDGGPYSNGGLVGSNYGATISNSYALGSVNGGSDVGGLVGRNDTWSSDGFIFSSFAVGSVSIEEDGNIGGAIGYLYRSGDVLNYENIGWWTGAGPENAIGYYQNIDEPVAEISHNEPSPNAFKNKNHPLYTTSGEDYNAWNFTTIWNIDPSFNDGYPYLRWQRASESSSSKNRVRIISSGGYASGSASTPYILPPDCTNNNPFSPTTGLYCSNYVPSSNESETSPSEQPFIFTQTLKTGDIHPEVKKLQQFLNQQGFVLTIQGPGSPNQETDKFGAFTRTALTKFQIFYKLTPDGVFGPRSREKANSLLSQ